MTINTWSGIISLKPGSSYYSRACGDCLHIAVYPHGGKSFFGQLRYKGEPARVWIGSTKKHKLKSARELWNEIRTWSEENDRHPREFKKPLKPQEEVRTFESVINAFLDAQSCKPITLRNYRRQLIDAQRTIEGCTPIKELEWDRGGRAKVVELRKVIEKRGALSQAERTQNTLYRLFEFAIGQGWIARNQNPAIKYGETSKHKPKNNPSITWDQVPKFLQAVSENSCNGHPITDLAVKTLLMTFLRVGALCRLEWDWYDVQTDCWIIPSETSGLKRKNGVIDRPHHIPMTEPLREVTEVLRHYTGHQKYVFLTVRGGKYPHLCLSAPNNHLKNLGYSGLLTAHGWRQVPMSAGQDVLGCDSEIIQRQMAHLLGDKTRKAYDNSTMLDERRKFMDAWCNALVEKGLRI